MAVCLFEPIDMWQGQFHFYSVPTPCFQHRTGTPIAWLRHYIYPAFFLHHHPQQQQHLLLCKSLLMIYCYGNYNSHPGAFFLNLLHPASPTVAFRSTTSFSALFFVFSFVVNIFIFSVSPIYCFPAPLFCLVYKFEIGQS